MNTPCRFDTNQMGFSGTPVEQAQCLLRFVKRVGNVDGHAGHLAASADNPCFLIR